MFGLFRIYPWKFRIKQSSLLEIQQNFVTPPLWKLQSQKPTSYRDIFFLMTPENSISFLINPCNLAYCYLDTPENSMTSTPTV